MSNEDLNLFNSNKVSVIVKSQIRYEGILYQINAQDKNITLTQVRSFGTEGRRPNDEIPPSPQVHEYIVFRGTDITDLKVLGPANPTPNQTPAKEPTASAQTNDDKVAQNKDYEESKNDEEEDGDKGDDFDKFMRGNEKFQMMVNNDNKQGDTEKSYKKNNFFDSISTSTTENSRDAGFDRQHQKKVDGETFGVDFYQKETFKQRGYNQGGNRHYNNNRYRGNNNNNYNNGGNNNAGGGYRGKYGGGNNNYRPSGERRPQTVGGQSNGGYQGGQSNGGYQGGYQKSYQHQEGGGYGGRNQEGGSYGGRNQEGGSYGGRNQEGGSYGGRNQEGGSYGGRNQEGGSYGGRNQEGGSYGGRNQDNDNFGGRDQGDRQEYNQSGYNNMRGGRGGRGGMRGGSFGGPRKYESNVPKKY